MAKAKRTELKTSYVERQNLTMLMHLRRFTRLTNAFSNKLEIHAHAVTVHLAYCNFCTISDIAGDACNGGWYR